MVYYDIKKYMSKEISGTAYSVQETKELSRYGDDIAGKLSKKSQLPLMSQWTINGNVYQAPRSRWKAVQEAGIDYHNYVPDAKDHLQQFYDTLKDKELARQLRMRMCETVRSVEEVLLSVDAAVGRQSGWGASSRGSNSNNKKDFSQKGRASVHVVSSENIQALSNQPRESNNRTPVCGHCKREGHTKEKCFKLQKCHTCGKIGHTVAYCIENARKVLERAEQNTPASRKSVSFIDESNTDARDGNEGLNE